MKSGKKGEGRGVRGLVVGKLKEMKDFLEFNENEGTPYPNIC